MNAACSFELLIGKWQLLKGAELQTDARVGPQNLTGLIVATDNMSPVAVFQARDLGDGKPGLIFVSKESNKSNSFSMSYQETPNCDNGHRIE